MRTDFDRELEERLVRYAAIDSQSAEGTETRPSTEAQWTILRALEAELREMGAAEVRLTDYGALLATIPATVPGPAPVMAWLAHVDTTPQFAASGVRPQVHRAWDGAPITFPDAPGLELTPAVSPYLGQCLGHDIVTASGTTLLGADDKAGVAIVMTAARHLLAQPGIPHGKIRLALTPDEEVGRGVHPDLPKDIGADFAFTFDGARRGEIEFESFSADLATVKVTGVAIHPGQGKDKMVNALTVAARIAAGLPQAGMTPETTAGREGFIHLYELRGTAAEAEMRLILRDFELDGLEAQGALVRALCTAAQLGEPRARVEVEVTAQYRNMRYWLEKDMAPVELARAACRDLGIEPVSVPIRGGTDGSRLTELGVPCPNLFTGMQEIHGPLEWVSVQDMGLATRLALRLAERAASGG